MKADMAASQGMPRIASNSQKKLDEARKEFSLELLESVWRC